MIRKLYRERVAFQWEIIEKDTGDSDLSLYCQDLKTNEFKELDRSSNTVIKVYDNFESMLADALESSLD